MKEAHGRSGVKIVGGLKESYTAWSGVSLLVDLYRKLEIDKLADKVLPAKKSSKGLRANGGIIRVTKRPGRREQ